MIFFVFVELYCHLFKYFSNLTGHPYKLKYVFSSRSCCYEDIQWYEGKWKSQISRYTVYSQYFSGRTKTKWVLNAKYVTKCKKKYMMLFTYISFQSRCALSFMWGCNLYLLLVLLYWLFLFFKCIIIWHYLLI